MNFATRPFYHGRFRCLWWWWWWFDLLQKMKVHGHRYGLDAYHDKLYIRRVIYFVVDLFCVCLMKKGLDCFVCWVLVL